MRASLIRARKKYFFTLFTKIWITFIASVFLLLNIFNFFVIYKNSDFISTAKELDAKRVVLNSDIDAVDAKISFILKQKAVAEEIYANNIILKDSMKNLFDLVPDQITLDRVIMKKNSLVIYGVTPTKDAYDFLLATPLKSIFHTSNVMFYLTKQGWYNFVSTNKIITMEDAQ